MLKKRELPGYLYMIDQGASTTWEYWSGERSKVHNCFNGIGAWFCQAVGGILPDEDEPGYKHFFIKPQIPNGVTWARAARETPYGTARVSWTMDHRIMSHSNVVSDMDRHVVAHMNGTVFLDICFFSDHYRRIIPADHRII